MRRQSRLVCRQGAALHMAHVAEVGDAQREEEPSGYSHSTGTGQSELSPSGPLSGVGGSRGLRRERLTRRAGISSLRFSTAIGSGAQSKAGKPLGLRPAGRWVGR